MTSIITIERHPNNDTRLPWRLFTYDMDNGHDIAKYIARERYAFPGGYELYAITDDGAVICNDCCRSEYYQIRTAVPGDGWNVEGYMSTAMDDAFICCEHCGRVIQDEDALPADAVHYLDSARGQYMPRDFFITTDPDCINWKCTDDTRDWIIESCSDPDSEGYWEAWNDCTIYDRMTVTDPGNDTEYSLHHDGDLWLVPVTG